MKKKRKNRIPLKSWHIVLSAILILLFALSWLFESILSPESKLEDIEIDPQPLAVQVSPPDFSMVSARSFVVMDFDSGQLIAFREKDEKLLPASLTKMITSLVILDNYSLDQKIDILNKYEVGKIMGIKPGTQMSIENLLYGLLVHSANDAAYAVSYDYNLHHNQTFIDAMNQKASQLGLSDTNFVNFDGEEDEGHYSTAKDLALLARFFLKNPVLSEMIKVEKIIVKDEQGNDYWLESTNELLKEDGFGGVKTGWTEQAGECFAGLYEQGDHKLITVVLGSKNRFEDTKSLVNQVMNNFAWE